jgi:energy-converting hydrogenase Eha subunit C
LALIVNVLVSIVACGAVLWMAARHWTTPPRLALSMGGSGLVAVAEVVVYMGYLRKVEEAKLKGRKHVEKKEIVNTWILGGDERKPLHEENLSRRSDSSETNSVRRRTMCKG